MKVVERESRTFQDKSLLRAIRKVFEESQISRIDLARILRISLHELSQILEKRVFVQTDQAVRIFRILGKTPDEIGELMDLDEQEIDVIRRGEYDPVELLSHDEKEKFWAKLSESELTRAHILAVSEDEKMREAFAVMLQQLYNFRFGCQLERVNFNQKGE